mmetsp:Transcript_27699/g.65054  ORF Transcript_27699/g.65054 Transcript_27699/m.65054 type:complete len:93 (+) Transcript_27699:4854-5132(+)
MYDKPAHNRTGKSFIRRIRAAGESLVLSGDRPISTPPPLILLSTFVSLVPFFANLSQYLSSVFRHCFTVWIGGHMILEFMNYDQVLCACDNR